MYDLSDSIESENAFQLLLLVQVHIKCLTFKEISWIIMRVVLLEKVLKGKDLKI